MNTIIGMQHTIYFMRRSLTVYERNIILVKYIRIKCFKYLFSLLIIFFTHSGIHVVVYYKSGMVTI